MDQLFCFKVKSGPYLVKVVYYINNGILLVITLLI